jgi:hypothetical protein
MTISELTVPYGAAWNAFQQYRAALRQRYSAEDDALMKAYRALMRQQRVIDLYGSIRQAGIDERRRPRLAIVRADAETVWCSFARDGPATFSLSPSWSRNAAHHRVVKVPSGTLPTGECRPGGDGAGLFHSIRDRR